MQGDLPGAGMLAHTLDERLERALLALSDNLRLCVVLVDIEGLEYAEAAEALGRPNRYSAFAPLAGASAIARCPRGLCAGL